MVWISTHSFKKSKLSDAIWEGVSLLTSLTNLIQTSTWWQYGWKSQSVRTHLQ